MAKSSAKREHYTYCYILERDVNLDDKKRLALQYCMDIALDYDEAEVKKWAPTSVQKAWEVGRDVLDHELKKQREKIKDFKI